MKILGLIGKNIGYTRSPEIFKAFFESGSWQLDYKVFDLEDIHLVEELFKNPDLLGFNVTIPYKQDILNYVDEQSPDVVRLKNANTIVIYPTGKKKAFNTDIYGIKKSLQQFLSEDVQNIKALILGTGATARSFSYVLEQMNIPHLFASRKPEGKNQIGYDELSEEMIKKHRLIINTTPLGNMHSPASKPDIPYAFLTSHHFLFDVHYVPEETLFLKEGKKREAKTINGWLMLKYQAEKAWEIWKNELNL